MDIFAGQRHSSTTPIHRREYEVDASQGKSPDTIMNRWHIDSESEQIREVYTWFGLAMFHAQGLERQLAIVLTTKYVPDPTRVSITAFDNILERLFSRTLGQLLKEVGTLTKLSEDEEERLQKALGKRNWLAHHYFWEWSVDFLSGPGRTSMIKELQELTDLFHTLAGRTPPPAGRWRPCRCL